MPIHSTPTMRTAVRLSLVVAMVLSVAAPASGQEVDNPAISAGVAAQATRPTLDDPASIYAPSLSLQSSVAAVQTIGLSMGTMSIPAINLEQQVYAGVDLSVLALGPGHWVGSAKPGEVGNMVIAGHRTTYGAPFHNLDLLEQGDMVFFERPNGIDAMYIVSETLIVNPEDIWITYETGEALATLFACHPKGSAAKRIVIRARLVGDGRIT